MLCRKNSSCEETGSVPVYLNVYDLTPINGYAYWFGLGVYHSGVQGQYYQLSYIVYMFSTSCAWDSQICCWGWPNQFKGLVY